MAHEPVFDSAWLKWGQAVRHAQALEADINAVTEDGNAEPVRTARADYNPKRHGFEIIATELAPIPARWRLMLGDIANNYRAALDHLAWALVIRGHTPPDALTPRQRKGVYFPINDDRRQFNGELPVKLPGVRRSDIAKVRRHQPYRNGPRNRPRHALVLLAAINNDDKHRTIQPIWAHPTLVKLEITDGRYCYIPSQTIHGRPEPLEVDKEFTFLPRRRKGTNPTSRCSHALPRSQASATAWPSRSGCETACF
jgi:hypothetical protein